jgi:hypothetical protein
VNVRGKFPIHTKRLVDAKIVAIRNPVTHSKMTIQDALRADEVKNCVREAPYVSRKALYRMSEVSDKFSVRISSIEPPRSTSSLWTLLAMLVSVMM